MILYFSATGNSKWVAREIAAATGDEALDVMACLKQGITPALPAATETVGIVFPIHSWYVPRPVLDFLSLLQLPSVSYRFAVCTCGDDAGKAMTRLARHFALDAAWSVCMPNTYIPMFELDSEQVASTKITSARSRIRQIAEDITQRSKVWDVHEGSFPWLKTYVVNPLFVHFMIRTKGFHSDIGCVSCGKCVKACPLANIALVSGRPEWGKHCIHCMACVHACPEAVIQYGKSTRKKGRYCLEYFLSR